MSMEPTATPPEDSKHSPDNGALPRISNDSKDVEAPANESAPPNTDNMDTRDDGSLTGPPNDSKEPANKSSAVSSSISPDSRTSTLKYDQEPFDRYRVRIEALCRNLWPADSRVATLERRMSSVAKFRILETVRSKKLRRLLFPSPEKEFIIERLAGGTYNRIAGIAVKDAAVKDLKHFILRVPRSGMVELGHIEREVAIVRYVRQNTTLPVADVLSFDATADNPLDSGYVVQSRLPGVPLHTIWDELTHEQRCVVAQEIGKVILALQDVKSPTPGIVEASLADDGSQTFSVRPFDIKSPYDMDWKTKIPNHTPGKETQTENQSSLNWFGTQFGRWLAHELLESPAQILYWDYQLQFVQAAKEMERVGYLGNGQNCLCHFDLEARNVMVQILPNGSPTISGIIDWDSAVFAPTFVSCAPPSWLWTDPKYLDEDEFEASSTPSTPEQKEIKEKFEEVVGFDWEWFAYQPGFRLARELFYFAQHGNNDNQATKRAIKFLKEWAALRDSKRNPKDDENSKDSISSDEIQEDEAMDEAKQSGVSA